MSEDIKFQKLKKEAEDLYKGLGEVYCPYFKEKIVFNAKGLEHLKFKKKNHARSQEDQNMRLKYLSLAPKILELSRTIQGISNRKSFEPIRSHSRTEMKFVQISYFEFIAILENVRVRVIIKQIENGPKYFWSIIPFWKMDKITLKRKMFNGDPEND